jgi:PTS system N-acetylgalactosamine-specific IIA component
MSSDGDGAPVRAVVAAHGDLAAGVISGVEQISGRGSVFTAISNAALDADGLLGAVRDAVQASAARVVFTDLPAGSCTIAARRLQREVPGLTVVTGVNLAMLLDFALKAGPADAAPARAAAKGREAITVAAPVEGSGVH